MELVLYRQGRPVHRAAVPGSGLTVGRREDNGLVLGEDSISRQHAHLFLFEGRLWLRDLGSANGTWVNDQKVDGAVPVDDRDLLRFGKRQEARLTGAPPSTDDHSTSDVIVEDVWSLVRTRLPVGFYGIDDNGVPVNSPKAQALLQVTASGQLFFHQGTTWQEMVVGEQHGIGGRTLQRVGEHAGKAATRGSDDSTGYPFCVDTQLNAAGGPVCWMGPSEAELQRVCGGNGAVLLYQLARRLHADREKGLAEGKVGWCGDDDLGRGIWGRQWVSHDPNGLHVLVFRVRKAISNIGLDPACIEKERGATRIYVSGVLEGAR